ncbi:MAG: TVP38/TMEM64 family protein [Bacilli bacterium]|nr:TVP38/TMEM64 family protein [Bacilli bacterium]
MDLIKYIIDHSTEFVSNGGMLVGFFLVFIECFIPVLPLSVFVALNVNAFGFLGGFLISWSATCLGSYLCYLFFLFIEGKLTEKFLKRKTIKKIKNSIDKFEKIKFTELVLIITLPFTPSCLVNILAGLTKVAKEKFLIALLIGKSFTIVFWGYIGKSLIESLTDLKSLIYIFVTLLLAYIISKIVSKKMHID